MQSQHNAIAWRGECGRLMEVWRARREENCRVALVRMEKVGQSLDKTNQKSAENFALYQNPEHSTNHASKIERFLRLLQKGCASAAPSPAIHIRFTLSPPRLEPSEPKDGKHIATCRVQVLHSTSDCTRPRTAVMTGSPQFPSTDGSSAPTSSKVHFTS